MEHKAEVKPVQLSPELTIYQAAERYEELSELLKRHGELHLDLSAVTEIDSTGLQLLMQLSRQAKQSSSTIVFLSPSIEIQQMMTLFRLSADFDMQHVQGSL